MKARPELSDLIRAMARRDWGTVDRLLEELNRVGWTGAQQILGAGFALAVHRRFRPGQPLEDIRRFVTDTRARYEDGKSLPALEMEGIIRAVLGETDLVDTIDPDVVFSMQIAVLSTLLQDEDMTEEQLEEFMRDVESTAAEYM